MRRIETLLGLPVVTVEEGLRLGTVKGVELDTAQGRIRYLRYDGAGKRTDGLIPWLAVRSIGADAVTINSRTDIQETVAAGDRANLTPLVGNRPVVTESGERVGTVTSYDVDETTGQIVSYHVACGGVLAHLTGRQIRFPHDAIRTFGQDAIIVADEVATLHRPAKKAA